MGLGEWGWESEAAKSVAGRVGMGELGLGEWAWQSVGWQRGWGWESGAGRGRLREGGWKIGIGIVGWEGVAGRWGRESCGWEEWGW